MISGSCFMNPTIVAEDFNTWHGFLLLASKQGFHLLISILPPPNQGCQPENVLGFEPSLAASLHVTKCGSV